jgi:hypothetical protein
MKYRVFLVIDIPHPRTDKELKPSLEEIIQIWVVKSSLLRSPGVTSLGQASFGEAG